MASMARGQCLNMYQTINWFESHHVVRVVQLWFFSGLVTDAAAFSSQCLSEPTGCPFVSIAWVDLCFPALKTLKRIKHPAISKRIIMSYAKKPPWKMVFLLDMDGHGGFHFHIFHDYFKHSLLEQDAFPMEGWPNKLNNIEHGTCSISGYLKYLQVGSIPRSCIICH